MPLFLQKLAKTKSVVVYYKIYFYVFTLKGLYTDTHYLSHKCEELGRKHLCFYVNKDQRMSGT